MGGADAGRGGGTAVEEEGEFAVMTRLGATEGLKATGLGGVNRGLEGVKLGAGFEDGLNVGGFGGLKVGFGAVKVGFGAVNAGLGAVNVGLGAVKGLGPVADGGAYGFGEENARLDRMAELGTVVDGDTRVGMEELEFNVGLLVVGMEELEFREGIFVSGMEFEFNVGLLVIGIEELGLLELVRSGMGTLGLKPYIEAGEVME